MQTQLSALLVLSFASVVSSWAPSSLGVANVPHHHRHYAAALRPSSRLFSVSIQDPNEMNNDFDGLSSLLPSPSLQTDPLSMTEPDTTLLRRNVWSSSSSVRWIELLKPLAMTIVGATVMFQLMLHQQHHARGWEFSEVVMRDLADTWSSYASHLESNPIMTKAVTSGTVYTIGDVIAQRTELQGKESGSSLDAMRVLRSCLAGLIGHGPLSHMWYNVCDYSFENVLHLSAAWWPLKILVD